MQARLQLLAALASIHIAAGAQQATAPAPVPCPQGVVETARCFAGEDGAGSHYLIALPAGWQASSGVAVMHAHGGPDDTGPARPERAAEDLRRWALTLKAGYAWAASTYRRGGFGMAMAAEDVERLRRIFVQAFGQPRRTLLHGQSYGGGVAARAAEMFPGGYDGVLLTSGAIGGASAYEFRLDLRAVYQHVCNNHPRPGEPPYALWLGLPPGAVLTRAELAARVDDCTGVRRPPAQRTAAQKANLATILDVVHIPERSLIGHMAWATWLARDVTQLRLGGRNPFSNARVRYAGSADDMSLNANVLRYDADAGAANEFARDTTPTGDVHVPTLTLHAIGDPTVFVEVESAYREIRHKAGTDELLVQTFSDEAEHSFLSDPQYPALFTALLDWIDRGDKPTPQKLLALCKSYEPAYGNACRLQPDYAPRPLASRVPER